MSDILSAEINKIPVETFMNAEVISVSQLMTIREAINTLKEKKISGGPVVDNLNKIVSVISQGNLLRLVVQYGFDKKIGQCMEKLIPTEKLITVKKSDLFIDVYKKFLMNPIERVYVTDGGGKLHGIVTRAHILDVLMNQGIKAS